MRIKFLEKERQVESMITNKLIKREKNRKGSLRG